MLICVCVPGSTDHLKEQIRLNQVEVQVVFFYNTGNKCNIQFSRYVNQGMEKEQGGGWRDTGTGRVRRGTRGNHCVLDGIRAGFQATAKISACTVLTPTSAFQKQTHSSSMHMNAYIFIHKVF